MTTEKQDEVYEVKPDQKRPYDFRLLTNVAKGAFNKNIRQYKTNQFSFLGEVWFNGMVAEAVEIYIKFAPKSSRENRKVREIKSEIEERMENLHKLPYDSRLLIAAADTAFDEGTCIDSEDENPEHSDIGPFILEQPFDVMVGKALDIYQSNVYTALVEEAEVNLNDEKSRREVKSELLERLRHLDLELCYGHSNHTGYCKLGDLISKHFDEETLPPETEPTKYEGTIEVPQDFAFLLPRVREVYAGRVVKVGEPVSEADLGEFPKGFVGRYLSDQTACPPSEGNDTWNFVALEIAVKDEPE